MKKKKLEKHENSIILTEHLKSYTVLTYPKRYSEEYSKIHPTK